MGKPDAPSYDMPSPEEIFESQAEWNRINQFGPGGSLIYSDDGKTATYELSPEQQHLQNMQNQLRGSALGRMMQMFGPQATQQARPLPPAYGENEYYEHEPGGVAKARKDPLPGEPGYEGGTEPGVKPPWYDDDDDDNDGGGGYEYPASDLPGGGDTFMDFLTPGGIGIDTLGPALPGDLSEYDEFRGTMEDELFERQMRLIRPELEQGRSRLGESLSNRGIPVGAELGEDLWDRFGRHETDVTGSAARESILGATQQMGMDLGMKTGIRQNTLQERLSRIGSINQSKMQEYNLLGSLLGMAPAQGGNMGNFYGPGQVDVTGPYQMQQQQQMWNQQNQGNLLGSLLGFGGNLGAMALLGSSVDFKKNIVNIDKHEILEKVKLLPVYSWQYKHEDERGKPHIGVMSEDFNEQFPGNAEGFIDISTMHGVALVSIQELIKEIDSLRSDVAELKGAHNGIV